MSVSGIYCFTNKITGEKYVGQSKNIYSRKRSHIAHSFDPKQKTYNMFFHQKIREYGEANFSFEVLEEVPAEKLDEREKYWIQRLNTLVPNGYNKSKGGIWGISLEQMKQNGENSKQYYLDNHGVTSAFALETVREKIKATMLSKYGVEYPQYVPEIRQRMIATCTEKFGGSSPFCSKEVHNKGMQTRAKKGNIRCVQNLETGLVFTVQEAAQWLNRKGFSSDLTQFFNGKRKSVGKVPTTGQKATWRLISYEEYERLK